jgi:hypothetical protein
VRWYRGSARRGGRRTGVSEEPASDVVDEGVVDYSLDELREFLEADLVDVYADLEFKQMLRQKLWDLVQARNQMRNRGASGR